MPHLSGATVVAVGRCMNQADHGIRPKPRAERPSVYSGWIWRCGCARVVSSHQLRESGGFNESSRNICVDFRDAPPLISEVEVEPHHSRDTRSRLTQRVDLYAGVARVAAEVLVIGVLDAPFTDLVAGFEPLEPGFLPSV